MFPLSVWSESLDVDEIRRRPGRELRDHARAIFEKRLESGAVGERTLEHAHHFATLVVRALRAHVLGHVGDDDQEVRVRLAVADRAILDAVVTLRRSSSRRGIWSSVTSSGMTSSTTSAQPTRDASSNAGANVSQVVEPRRARARDAEPAIEGRRALRRQLACAIDREEALLRRCRAASACPGSCGSSSAVRALTMRSRPITLSKKLRAMKHVAIASSTTNSGVDADDPPLRLVVEHAGRHREPHDRGDGARR